MFLIKDSHRALFHEYQANRPGIFRAKAEDPLPVWGSRENLEYVGTEPLQPLEVALDQGVGPRHLLLLQSFNALLMKFPDDFKVPVFELALVIEGIAIDEVAHFRRDRKLSVWSDIAR